MRHRIHWFAREERVHMVLCCDFVGQCQASNASCTNKQQSGETAMLVRLLFVVLVMRASAGIRSTMDAS